MIELNYKGYAGRVHGFGCDAKGPLFHGEVVHIRDVVTFQSRTAEGLVQAFHDSVDDYLAFCAERGEEPNKPCTTAS